MGQVRIVRIISSWFHHSAAARLDLPSRWHRSTVPRTAATLLDADSACSPQYTQDSEKLRCLRSPPSLKISLFKLANSTRKFGPLYQISEWITDELIVGLGRSSTRDFPNGIENACRPCAVHGKPKATR